MNDTASKDEPIRQVGPGVWTSVDPATGRILNFAVVGALACGLVGGSITGRLLDIGFLGFVIGYGGFGVLGKLVGVGVAMATRSNSTSSDQ